MRNIPPIQQVLANPETYPLNGRAPIGGSYKPENASSSWSIGQLIKQYGIILFLNGIPSFSIPRYSDWHYLSILMMKYKISAGTCVPRVVYKNWPATAS